MKSCALRASVISITLCCIAWIPIISSGFLLDGEDYVGSARTCDAQPQLLRAVTALAPKPVDGVVCICVDGKLQSIIPTRFGCILCPHNDICMGHECPPFTLTSALTASASITGVLIFVPFSKSNPSNLFHVLFDDLYAIWCSLERIDSVSGRPPYNWLIFPVFSLTPLQFQALEILFPEISRAVSSSPVDVLLGTHSECRIIQGESLHLPESFNTTVLISSPKPDESRDSQFDRFVQAILSTVVPDKNLTQSVLLLSRSNSHRRRLLNEPECALALARLAQSHHLRFEYVTNLSELPLHEQIRLVSSAKMIVGVHGAAMSLATFLPEGSIVVEIFPERFWRSTFQLISQRRDLTHISLWSRSPRAHSRFCATLDDPARRLQCLRDADGWLDVAFLLDTVSEQLLVSKI